MVLDNLMSLFSLNFMTSLRTGNIIVDMLIAILVPYMAHIVMCVLTEAVPFLASVIGRLGSMQTTAQLTFPTSSYYNYGPYLEERENMRLHLAVQMYVTQKLKPRYRCGALSLMQLPVEPNKDASKVNKCLAESIRENYRVMMLPRRATKVEVAPGVWFQITDIAEEDVYATPEGAEPQRRGEKAPVSDDVSVVLRSITLESYHMGGHAKIDAFVQEAYAWYIEQVRKMEVKTSYLYQPVLDGTGDKKADDDGDGMLTMMTCRRYPLSSQKTFNTLFFPEKEQLIELIDRFQRKEGKFSVPGFAHKLSLLLHGPPGTGKTSLVKALAAYTNRSIVAIPLSRVKTNSQLMSYMFNETCRIVKSDNGSDNAENGDDYDYDGTNKDNDVVRLGASKVIFLLEDIDAASGIVLKNSDESMNKDVQVTDVSNDGDSVSNEPAQGKECTDDVESDTPGEANTKESGVATENEEEQASVKTVTSSSDDTGGDESGVAACDDADSSTEAVGSERQLERRRKGERCVKVVAGRSSKKSLLSLAREDDDRLNLKGILAVLDGIVDAPMRIVVMTTNHVELLDPALLRPGRITKKLWMGQFTPQCAIELVKHYYGADGVSESQCEEIMKLVSLHKSDGSRGISPAEMEQFCAEQDTVEGLIAACRRGTRCATF